MSSKYLYIVLLGLVALSKEFLVFNEEVLVLLAFAIFVYLLVNYGGEMIAAELDSRKEKIKEEFDLYKNLQEKTFTHLIKVILGHLVCIKLIDTLWRDNHKNKKEKRLH